MKRIKIRKNFFETNSSSLHAICIPKETSSEIKLKNNIISVRFCEFYRKFYVYTNINSKLSYILTYFLDTEQLHRIVELLYKLKNKYKLKLRFNSDTKFLDNLIKKFENNKEIDYSKYNKRIVRLSERYSIDHYKNAKDIIETITSSDDILEKYLFGDSYIYTGSDEILEKFEIDKYNYCKHKETHDIFIKMN